MTLRALAMIAAAVAILLLVGAGPGTRAAEVSGEHPSREEQAGSQALRILRLA